MSTNKRAYAALQGVGRALLVLEAVAEKPMRSKEVAERLGLKWTTAHRTLTHLLEQRYLRRDDASGLYSIGPRLYYLDIRTRLARHAAIAHPHGPPLN